MGEKSKIQWTNHTWACVQGCDYVSPGCTHCYVVPMLHRLSHNPNPKVSAPLQGLVTKNATGALHFTGKVKLREDRLGDPFGWKPGMVFVPSHGDIFHESVPFWFLDKIWAVMAMTPQHTYQVLTKRPARMRRYVADMSAERCAGRGNAVLELAKQHQKNGTGVYLEGFGWPLPNVWLGVSTEDQPRFNERWPDLRDTPAAKRFISYEPALGLLSLTDVCNGAYFEDVLAGVRYHDAPAGVRSATMQIPHLDWGIGGLESGGKARQGDVQWLHSFVRQFERAGRACFIKQLGRRPVDSRHMHAAGAGGPVRLKLVDRKGGDMEEWPESLRVRQFPT